jgi:hypothetical protein
MLSMPTRLVLVNVRFLSKLPRPKESRSTLSRLPGSPDRNLTFFGTDRCRSTSKRALTSPVNGVSVKGVNSSQAVNGYQKSFFER